MPESAILHPVLALIAWTFVMWTWMYATRIPAIQRANIDMDELSRTGGPLVMPPEVARIADNYNHLHEQPTIFYALVLCAAMLGAVDAMQIALAWGYVAVRIVHSLIHATRNIIFLRFLVFAIGSLILLTLLLHTVYLVA